MDEYEKNVRVGVSNPLPLAVVYNIKGTESCTLRRRVVRVQLTARAHTCADDIYL